MNKGLRVAFIAKYAPPNDSQQPVYAIEENAVYARYHFDVYRILKKSFPNLVTGVDANFLIENHENIDYVFSLLNRAPYRNSEILLSALAEYYKVPYLGARPNIRALAEDKNLAKLAAERCGLETPKWFIVDVGHPLQNAPPFSGPFFVKPRYGASSQYIDENSICETWEDVRTRVAFLHQKQLDVIVEEFIDGIYYSSPVILQDGQPFVLPPVQEKSELKGNVVTYRQKRKTESGLTRSIENDQKVIRQIRLASEKFSQFIQPIDYTRIDYILERSGALKFIEFNVCCNLGIQSAFILSAQSIGLTQENIIEAIVKESLARQGIV